MVHHVAFQDGETVKVGQVLCRIDTGGESSSGVAEDASDEATDNTKDTQASSEDDTWTVTIADRPADEVGVRLCSQRPFHCCEDGLECRWVCGVGKSVQQVGALLARQVELARCSVRNVNGDDAV